MSPGCRESDQGRLREVGEEGWHGGPSMGLVPTLRFFSAGFFALSPRVIMN